MGQTSDDVPQLIVEAYLRLKGYYEDTLTFSTPAGSSKYSNNIGDAIQEDIERSPTWVAKAMQFSGCADLLRTYRRV